MGDRDSHSYFVRDYEREGLRLNSQQIHKYLRHP